MIRDLRNALPRGGNERRLLVSTAPVSHRAAVSIGARDARSPPSLNGPVVWKETGWWSPRQLLIRRG
jgi:hypothetical protein